MSSSTVQATANATPVAENESSSALHQDPRWQLIERIVATEPFQKSTRLPGLLLYLARHTIQGDRLRLTEQAIGQSVFGKRQHYNPAEDSAVRVYIRQLRLRLHEYYQSPNVHETLIASIPKGGYALDFSPAAYQELTRLTSPVASTPVDAVPPISGQHKLNFYLPLLILTAVAVVCGIGWYRAASARSANVPWPLDGVFHKGEPTTLVLADAGFALRMLGDQEVSLDRYIDHSYLQAILPKHMTDNESIVLHYFDSTRVTSEADAHAAAVLASLAGPYGDNLLVRSARDINANELAHGNFIFLGSKTSNPWVELFDSRMNFQIVENGPHGVRYVFNRAPQPGEQPRYQSDSMGTLASGDDYAVIALLPAKAGSGSSFIVEGVRMEGTNAAIALLRNPADRARLLSKLSSLNAGKSPQYFEAVLHAQSVAGATMSVDVLAARVLH